MGEVSPFDPVTIGPLKLRNRFIKSATNEGMAKEGVVTKGLARFHEQMAAGGVGVSTVAYCAVSPDGRTFVDQATLDRESLPDFKALVEGIHRHGAAASAQITHGGCFTFLTKAQSTTPRPLSASGGFNKVGIMSNRLWKKAMDRAEMDQIAGEFVHGAELAREAGFDAVEIHMGHGYLLSQYLSPFYNKRNDAYGGSIDRRVRFPNEVLARVLDAVGKDLAVIVKYSMTDGAKGGNTIEDGIVIAKSIEATGAHMAVLSNGLNIESITAMFGNSFPKENRGKPANPIIAVGMWLQSLTEPKNVEFHPRYLRQNALRIRDAVNMPLCYLGGVTSLADAQEAIDDGFDAIAMGRILIHDPGVINQFRAGTTLKSGCTACNRCVTEMYTPAGTSCVLTRATGDAELNKLHAGAAA